MKAKLYYDGNCPVCTNFVKLLQRKLDPERIEFVPTNTNAKDFQFILGDGSVFYGEQAIEQMAMAFPRVKNFFWMLPDKYKIKALQTAYKVGGMVRNLIKPKKGCGCGGKRR